MNLFQLLQSHGLQVNPSECKFHFARSPHQKEKDLFATRAGFEHFQGYQSQKNFSRPYVISFYEYGEGLWMFAGVWRVDGEPIKTPEFFQYKFSFVDSSAVLERRLIVTWLNRFRNSYPNGETLNNELQVHSVLAVPDVLGNFPGFSRVRISLAGLRILLKDPVGSLSWKTALQSVAGVYVLADAKKDKLYVGAAYGAENLWQRWSEYAKNGHGGNAKLKQEYAERGDAVFDDYVFSLVWHADSSATQEQVQSMESFWKEALLTRGSRGYNAN
jgi:hypothetical protein